MATPKPYKLYAALHEDIAEGFVWLKHEGRSSRSIVKITYGKNRPVFCEALQLENSFLKLYNRRHCEHQPKYRIEGESLASSMVINHWYRARLVRRWPWRGRPEPVLETQREYALKIAGDQWYNNWWWKLRACMGHPQVVVRVAVWLGIISVGFGMLGTVPGAIRCVDRRVQSAKSSVLSVDEVLAWRRTYGDLLGKPREAVIQRFGKPKRNEGAVLTWDEAPRTGNRFVAVVFDSVDNDGIADGVKVGAHEGERLDVMGVLRKALIFDFATGTYTDTALNYFTAATKDGRNTLQFDVTESGMKFGFLFFKK